MQKHPGGSSSRHGRFQTGPSTSSSTRQGREHTRCLPRQLPAGAGGPLGRAMLEAALGSFISEAGPQVGRRNSGACRVWLAVCSAIDQPIPHGGSDFCAAPKFEASATGWRAGRLLHPQLT
jgi:hypothetical protein